MGSLANKYGISPLEDLQPKTSLAQKYGVRRFPPPLPGSIPQADVTPGAEDTSIPLEMLKATGRNVAGIAMGGAQAARHPIATATGTVAGTVGGLMSLAELASPLDAGNFPGHQAVQKVTDWSKEKIASDAPFKEAGQYAAAVPDVAGMVAPLAGITKIPGVAAALGKVAVPLRTAAAGRKVLETFPQVTKLGIVDEYLKNRQAPKALKYIDDPSLAPTPVLKQAAQALSQARDADHANWNDLTYGSRALLAKLGNYKNSVRPQFQQAAVRISTVPFASPSPGQLAETEKRNQIEKIMDRYLQPIADYAFRRPGAKGALAAHYKDDAVKRVLKKGIPGAIEATEGEHRALSSQTDHFRLKIVEQLLKDAGGDLDEMDRLAKEATAYAMKGTGQISHDLEQVVDEAVTTRRARLEETASMGLFSVEDLNRLRDPRELFLKVYAAAHDPGYVREVRTKAAWQKVFKLVSRYNKGASPAEVNGAIEKMLDVELARIYERTGRLAGGKRGLAGNPLLERVMSKPRGKSALRAAAEEIYGPVEDLPSALELSGEVLSRARAKNMMNQSLLEDMHSVGLAVQGPKGPEGHANLRKVLRLKYDVWAPKALEEVFAEGENAARDMGEVVKMITKMGAAWRAGSTIYSPTTAVQNSLSNLFSVSGTGDLYRQQFFPSMVHSLRQGWSVIRRGGQAMGSRAAEEAMARRSLGGGTVAGELGQILTDIGATPKIRRAPKVPAWMGGPATHKAARRLMGRLQRTKQLARDVFEQGDVVPKRVVAELIASDFDQIAKNGTPGDIQRIMQGLYGSTDPGIIAADMTANMMQSYNRLPQMWRDLGRSPFLGLFTAFPAESMRNFQWQARHIGKALKGAAIAESPVVRQILLERAVRQIGGMSINLRFLSEMGEIAEEEIGPELSEKQQEALRTLAVPEWDRGPLSVLKRDGNKVLYAPAGNLEYFQGPRRLLSMAGKLAGHIARGEFNMIQPDSMDIIERLSDDLFQFQQPGRGILETVSNQRIEPSPVSWARARYQDRTPSQLSANPISTEAALEAISKGLLPGILPTPIRQAHDLYKWGTAPAGEEDVGRSPREISPFKVKTIDTLQQMGIAGGKYSEEKNNFSSRLKRINEREISPQEKAKLISALRDDWNEDLGPRLAREVALWRSLHSRKEVLDAMKTLGHASAIPAMSGRVPDFYQVFGNSIPGRVKFYMRSNQ